MASNELLKASRKWCKITVFTVICCEWANKKPSQDLSNKPQQAQLFLRPWVGQLGFSQSQESQAQAHWEAC